MNILGVDIGGSGIKAGIVDTIQGDVIGERIRIPTAQPSLPASVALQLKKIVQNFSYTGPIGIGFPAAITDGEVRTASNIHKSWKGLQIDAFFSEQLQKQTMVINDADAAGFAEIGFGAGKDCKGLVIVVTVGTGIGTAVFIDGILLPNTELGHLDFKGNIAEKYVSDAVRKDKGLSWQRWGKRFNAYLLHLEKLFYPQLFIIGGGASRKFEKFEQVFTTKAPVLAAKHRNNAGLIGAAVAMSQRLNTIE